MVIEAPGKQEDAYQSARQPWPRARPLSYSSPPQVPPEKHTSREQRCAQDRGGGSLRRPSVQAACDNKPSRGGSGDTGTSPGDTGEPPHVHHCALHAQGWSRI
jgi:hypothetical protein